MSETLLEIKNLHAKAGDKEIIKGLDLKINKGEVHVIMGPNGAGKSTLSNVILANPEYTQTEGDIILDGENINGLKTDERARKGIFMSFQSPKEIPGVSVTNFLKYAKIATTGKPVKIFEFKKELEKNMEELKMKPEYANRNLNVGFSGGERKKNEILQMNLLKPKMVLLDEIDSGLDVDSLKIVGNEVMDYYKREKPGMLVITHYQRLLDYIVPDYVHIMKDGHIIKSGNKDLVKEIEEFGYDIKVSKNSTCVVKEKVNNE